MRLPALLAFLLAVLAQPLSAAGELRGIPSDVDLALSISYETAAKSRLHPALRAMQDRMEKLAAAADPEAHRRNQALAKALGVTPDSNRNLDLGLRARTEAGEPDIDVFAVARIDMRKAGFDTYARGQGASPVAVGDLTGWELKSLLPALMRVLSGSAEDGVLPADMPEGYAVAMPSDNLLFIAPIRELAKVHDAWRGKAPSYAFPEPARRLAEATPLCHTRLHADLSRILSNVPASPAEEPAGGLQSVTLHLGEDSKSVLLAGGAAYRTEAQAKLGAEQLRALIPIAGMAAIPADEDDETTRFLKGEVAALLATLRVAQDGVSLRMTAGHPLDRVEKILAKVESLVTEIASAAGAAPSPDPTPARPAARLEPAEAQKDGQKGR
jgi:hypothetical protein